MISKLSLCFSFWFDKNFFFFFNFLFVFLLQPGSVIFGNGSSDLNLTTCKKFDDGNHTDLQDYIQKVCTHSGIYEWQFQREVWFPDLDLILISLIFNCKSWSSNQENLIFKSWFPDLYSILQIKKTWSSNIIS